MTVPYLDEIEVPFELLSTWQKAKKLKLKEKALSAKEIQDKDCILMKMV